MSFGKLLLAVMVCFACLPFACAEARAQGDERARAAAEVESLREQIKAREAVLLAPSKEDREAHAGFLAQPRTGLVRLLPHERWMGKLSTRGDGAFYSFARLTQEYGHGSDIMLEQDNFRVVMAGADFGFMVNLGNVPVETVSGETEAVQFMASFKTPSAEAEARGAQRQFASEGQPAGQWTYRSRLPVFVNNTYALRSVNYHNSDVLVVFRVIRKDLDGSVVLLWKLLEKYPKPTLRRGEAAAGGR